MDAQVGTDGIAKANGAAPASVEQTSEARKKDKGDKRSGGARKTEGKAKRGQRPTPLQAPQYQLACTVLRKNVKVGDTGLTRMLERQWTGIHYAIYYVNVFAPSAIGGRIVHAANAGVREYIEERLVAAERMLGEAQQRAADAGIEVGAPGKVSEHVIEIVSQLETDVLRMVRAYDDYLVVMDSLWMERELADNEKDHAHRIVRDDILALQRLMSQIRSKLINYRREKGTGTMTKRDEVLVTEVEDLIIASLSEEARQRKLAEREKQEARARQRDEAARKRTERELKTTAVGEVPVAGTVEAETETAAAAAA